MNHRKIVPAWATLLLSLSILLVMASALFAELINDGSFENSPSAWEEFFNNACNPSGIGNWSNIPNGPDNFDGRRSLWVGGFCDTNPPLYRSNGAWQTITLAEDAALLSFWYNAIKFDPDPLNLDHAIVSINETEIWTVDVDGINNPTGWNNAIVNISQFAGQTVTLTLAMEQFPDNGTANVFFDAIEVFHPQATISQSISPTAVPEGSSFSVEMTVENSGDTLLSDLSVANTTFSTCNQASGDLPDLAPGETIMYSCQVNDAAQNMENTATIEASTTAMNYMVSANDTVTVNIVNPFLNLDINPESVSVFPGEQILFSLTLSNLSTASVQNVQIDSNPNIGCSASIGTLAPGQRAELACTHTPTQNGTITFTASGEELPSNTEIYSEKVVTIELLPILPPSVPNHTLYLPAIANNFLSQSSLGEPNDLCNQAYPISINHSHEFLPEDAHDWYKFSLGTGGNISVQLSNFEPIAGQITLWRGNCGALTLIGQNGDFSTTKSINLTNQSAGTYFIWLINDSENELFKKYTLTVTVQ